jgi:glycosyltransferase involved in cell wall biosynthesis
MSFTQTLALNRELRALPQDEIIDLYSSVTTEAFSGVDEDATPVVVCAHNEAADIGSTLVSLAMSDRDMRPIVVDNGSTDETAAIAETMGATVLSEPRPSKMRAYKAALGFLDADIMGRTVLFTDADTIVGTRWAERLSNFVETLDEGDGGIAFGLVMFSHSQSRLTNSVRNLSHSFGQLRSRMSKGIKPPIARGANCAIHFDDDGAILERLLGMRHDVFPQDQAVRDAIIELGGLTGADLHPDSTVLSRGDRYGSILEYIRARRRTSNYKRLYAQDYGDDHPAYADNS